MRWRLGLSLLFFPFHAAAWQQQTGLEAQLQRIEIETSPRTDLPSFDTETDLKASTLFLDEGQASRDRIQLTADLIKSLNTSRDVQSFQLQAVHSEQAAQNSHRFAGSLLELKGVDLVRLPIELTPAQNPETFHAAQFDYLFVHDISLQQSLSTSINLSRNMQKPTTLNTEDASISWIYRPERLWVTVWSLRGGEQQGLVLPNSSFRELTHSQVYSLTPRWTVEGNLGYSLQNTDGQHGRSLLFMTAFTYSSKPLASDGTAPANRLRNPLVNDDLTSQASLLGTQSLRAGWSRSQDQRRAGDPFFIGDRWFLSCVMPLSAGHALQGEVSSLRSAQGSSLAQTRALREQYAGVRYRWVHWQGSAPASPKGILGLEVSREQTRTVLQDFDRKIYAVHYSLIL